MANLPTIIITGTTQESLFELIVLAGMLGYEMELIHNYDFNDLETITLIRCYGNKDKCSSGLAIFPNTHYKIVAKDFLGRFFKTFRADQVQDIINYVTDYENGN